MRLSLLAVAAVASSLAVAPAASAYKLAPPGNSAVSQYVENVPGAKGNVPSNAIRSHKRQADSGAVAPSTQQALVSQGADGVRAAGLANATAPAGVRGENRRRRRGGAGSAAGGQGPGTGSGTLGTGSGRLVATPVSGSVASPAGAVLKAVTGSATHGLGALLPVILVLSAIGAGLLAALRRRRTT